MYYISRVSLPRTIEGRGMLRDVPAIVELVCFLKKIDVPVINIMYDPLGRTLYV